MKPKALLVALLAATSAISSSSADESDLDAGIFAKEKLVAWCIVPFDAKKRGPAERAAMIRRLGLQRVAYDWRAEHVPTFEEEILQYKKLGIEYFAFWSWHDAMEPLIKKHAISPQIWQTCPSPKGHTQDEKVAAAAKAMLPLVEKARELNVKLGLYNHGGWGGEPKNLVAVCKRLRAEHDAAHVGIVYNFHHGHGDIDGFSDSLAIMMPYLICLNLNGMAGKEAMEHDARKNKILPIGSGEHELEMIRIVSVSGYNGPIGILDHRGQLDAEESLRQNIEGLENLLSKVGNDVASQTNREPIDLIGLQHRSESNSNSRR